MTERYFKVLDMALTLFSAVAVFVSFRWRSSSVGVRAPTFQSMIAAQPIAW